MNTSDFTPYQYSVIRYHHDATTHEFLNIGLSLFAPAFKYFKTVITPKYSRITDTFYNADVTEYRNNIYKLMRRFEKLSDDVADPNSDMFTSPPNDIEVLLRKYLRKESSIRYSNPSSGIAPAILESVEETFNRLFFNYVEKYIPVKEKDTRDEEQIWKEVYRPKIQKVNEKALDELTSTEIITPLDNLFYEHAWKNAGWHLIEPISFDLKGAGYIIEKARKNLGKNVLLNRSREVSHLYILLGEPKNKDESINKSYQRARDIIALDDYKYKLDLIEENGAADFASHLWSEMSHSK